MTRFVLLTFLAVTRLALAGPLVGPERPLDAPLIVPAKLNTVYPAAGASNGSVSLIAWFDLRHTVNYDYRLYVTRVDATGQVLDKPFLELGGVAASTSTISVAWDGTNFVVAWPSETDRSILYRRVSAQGALVDAMPRVARSITSGGSLVSPVLSTNGAGSTLLAWLNRSTAQTPEAVRLDAMGNVLDATPLALGTSVIDSLSAAFDGTQHVVVFNSGAGQNFSLNARRVSTGGALVDASPITLIALGNSVTATSTACGAQSCLVSFEQTVSGRTALRGVRLSSAGAVLDPTGVTLLADTTSVSGPSLSWDGAQYWLVGNRSNDALAQRLAPTATAIGTPVPVGSSTLYRLTGFVSAGTHLSVIDPRSQQVFRLSATGTLVDTTVIPYAANDQRNGRLAFGQNVLLAAWVDTREGGLVLFVRRFDPAGQALDAAPIKVAAESTGFYLNVLDLTFDGANFVLAYSYNSQQWLTRISPQGAVLELDGGVPTGVSGSSALVSDGTQTWLLFDALASGLSHDVFAKRFSRAGVLDTSPLPLATASTLDERMPTGCFDGTQVWVGWLSSGLTVSRLSPTGTLLDPGGVTIAGSTSYFSSSSPPRLASGTPCAAFWPDTGRSLRVANVQLDGGTATVVTDSARTTTRSTASFDGSRWVFGIPREAPDLAVTRWWNGSTIDAMPTTVPVPLLPLSLSSASDGRGTTWVLTHRFDNRPAVQAQRLFLQVVKDLPNGEVCGSGPECQSGNCVDGVCCNSACAGGTMDCQACSVSAGAAVNGQCSGTTGNACSDSNQCTQVDSCSAGVCVGLNRVTCPPPNECEVSNVCAPASGMCVVTPRADGTACSGGRCRGGQCEASDGGVGGGAAGGGSVGGGSAGGGSAGGGSAGGGSVGGGSVGGGSVGGGSVGSVGGGSVGGGSVGSVGGGSGGSVGGGAGGGGAGGGPGGCGCNGASSGQVFALLSLLLLGRLRRRRAGSVDSRPPSSRKTREHHLAKSRTSALGSSASRDN